MKKYSPTKLLLSFLGLATFASLVGTVSGTLAWYAYSTRATVSYSGTSVTNTVQLQAGIASPNKVLSIEEAREQNEQNEDMTDEEKRAYENMFVDFWDIMQEVQYSGDSTYYYFAPAGAGLESSIINAYLASNGYATNCLMPVTSGSFERGDNFSLKSSPNPDPIHNLTPANQEYYAVVPFIFRVIRTNTAVTNVFEPNVELWLTDVEASAYDSSLDGDIYKAIRMYIDRDNDDADYQGQDFILNPSASDKGSTAVGGLLNLSRDEYYDYDENDNEIIYGEYESIGGRSTTGYDGPDAISDINNTRRDTVDTFTAKHRSGVNYYANYNDCVFKTADYEALNTIAPLKDPISGELYNREGNVTSVCKTADESDHWLGRVTFTIYLEGWDHSVIDQEENHYFNLGLTFEINKLGA